MKLPSMSWSLLITAPVHAYPQLETDASGCGLGAVLGQEQSDGKLHPIAYDSHSLYHHEQNYGISELETLRLVWSVKHFHMYLLGHHCTVYTDHSACVSLLNTPKHSTRLCWAMTIQEFNLTIKHRAGRKHQRADTLSRNPKVVTETNVNAVIAEEPSDQSISKSTSLTEKEQQHLDEIHRLQQEDSEIMMIFQYLEDSKLPDNDTSARRLALEKTHYEIIDGILYFENPSAPGKWRIAISKELQATLLSETHDLGEHRVYNVLLVGWNAS